MEKEIEEKYKKVGKITSMIREEARKSMKPGMRILDLAESIEKRIVSEGLKPAFPVNISINEIAAHYTPKSGDEIVIKEDDIVKVDIGAHLDGYIADTAFTYCSKGDPMVDAVNECLEEALKILRPGMQVSGIGKAIEGVVKSKGFGLIVNLTGHGLDRYSFHHGPTIPNISNDLKFLLEKGMAFAIEPFVTTSNGYTKESGMPEIFRHIQDKPVRLSEAREILEAARNYKGFPFAKRWLQKELKISPIKMSMALRQLEMVNAIESYPPLKEVSGKKISQAEHTVIMLEDGAYVTTR